jgi:uncharacterized protein YjbI with pentapeptide repeats
MSADLSEATLIGANLDNALLAGAILPESTRRYFSLAGPGQVNSWEVKEM